MLDYRARWYDPYLNRFISPDSIVPDPANPQSFNRFAYVYNNPLKYTDPSGHRACLDWDENGRCTAWEKPTYVRPPQNPWTDKIPGHLLPSGVLDFLFLSEIESPLDDPSTEEIEGGWGPFGGCNTLQNSCAYGWHAAIDSRGSANKVGTPIFAATYGVVVDTGVADFGNYVLIEHDVYGIKYYSVYAHLDSITVRVGQEVDHQTQIGTMGKTEGVRQSDGTWIAQEGAFNVHLHFEIRRASNVDLSNSEHPFRGKSWWVYTTDDLKTNFVDLGLLPWVSYSSDFEDLPAPSP